MQNFSLSQSKGRILPPDFIVFNYRGLANKRPYLRFCKLFRRDKKRERKKFNTKPKKALTVKLPID